MNAQLKQGELMPETGTEIAEFNATAAGLAELRQQIEGATFDCSTAEGDKLARDTRRTLVSLRTSLEEKRKELKAPLLEQGRKIDEEARRITGEIVALETPIDEVIKAAEAELEARREAKRQAERERVAAIERQIDRIRNLPLTYVAADSLVLREALDEVKRMECRESFDSEFLPRALEARDAALAGLQRALDARLAADAEAERLAAERAEFERQRAEQAEADRIERERQAAKQAEADRIAREAREKADREAREAREAQAEADRAERERQAAEQQRVEEQQRAEAQRLNEERARLEREAAERREREEAEAIERATLDEATREARDFLLQFVPNHIVTRKLDAALARADAKRAARKASQA